jgi:hypothetical protein
VLEISVRRDLNLLTIAAIAAALTIGRATVARAQVTDSPRPVGGVFGDPGANENSRRRLDFTLDVAEAFDTDVPAEHRPTVAGGSPVSGGYSTVFVASADYGWRRPRAEFDAVGTSAVQYYEQLDQVKTLSHSAGVGLSARLPQRTTLLMSQTAAYSPSFLYQLFPTITGGSPADAIPTAPDYDLAEWTSYSYATRMSLTRGSDRGSRVTAAGEFDRTDFEGQDAGRADLRIHGIEGRFSHGVRRNALVSVAYHYRAGEFGYGGPTTEQRLTFGVDYSRPLSRTRRAVFRLNVASSRIEIPDTAVEAVLPGRTFRLHGEFLVDYQFRRTWQAHVNYRRGLEYVAVLAEPVFSDGAVMGVHGLAARRVHMSGSAAYSRGQSVLYRNAMAFDTYKGDMRVAYALNRALAVYAEYQYYFFDFRGNAGLGPSIPQRLERNSVRIGVTLWYAAFGR